jgi:secondary thiamine-phosphate synthase enzyme
MTSHRETIERRTTAETDLLDITDEVIRIVSRSGVTDGIATVFVPGSTASVTTIEYESGAVADLRRCIERMAPVDLQYDHDARWGDGNGYSHVRAAMLGPSIALPIAGGRPVLGTWQQVLLCDFDNRPRTREILVQIVGEGG